jgi:hypothetical protein
VKSVVFETVIVEDATSIETTFERPGGALVGNFSDA